LTDAQTTVYNKGAEVIRLYETVLGKDGFRKGMDLYFQRHDGQAITCEDFTAAMSDANGKDLSKISLWYSQAGTPTLNVEYSHDSTTGSCTITLSQTFPPCSAPARPCLIPCRTALFGSNGAPLQLFLDGVSVGNECVLEFDQWTQSFHFVHVGSSRPVPSFLRGFSAPVNCVIEGQSDADLLFLLSHDTDGFNRNEVVAHYSALLHV
jgi:aminopeptidase N